MKFVGIVCALSIACFINLAGASGSVEHSSHGRGHGGGHASLNHVALFSGATTNFAHDATDFTLGLDYERRLPWADGMFGVGLFAESIFAEHSEYLFGLPLFAHPYEGLKIYAAPAVIIAEVPADAHGGGHSFDKFKRDFPLASDDETNSETKFVVRVGLGYDFHVNRISLGPLFEVDYMDGDWAGIYGLSFGFGF